MTTRKASKRAKPTNLVLRDEDHKKVKELMSFLLEQGDIASTSLIVRAALLCAKPGKAFRDAYKQAASADMRFKAE